MPAGFIPPHGGYKKLKSYQKALIIYDATRYFCARFFPKDRRQTDQMEQAARSGKQNIVEGSLASATSKQTEIHLTNVAKASLGELLEDYEDFLRLNQLQTWGKDHLQARQLTARSRQEDDLYDTYRADIEHVSPEVSANTIRHLILQATFLLSRQIQRLEQEFLEQGGIRERMTAARLEARSSISGTAPHPQQTTVLPPPRPLSPADDSQPPPNCPQCGAIMVRRTARTGARAGNAFWGCSGYPQCKGTRALDAGKEEKQGGR